jgi:tetratricopeptide (TPR) repeat protein
MIKCGGRSIRAKLVLILVTLVMLCAPALGQTTAKDWFDKGNALFNESKYNESIGAFDEAIELNPQYAKAWYNKGLVLYYLGNLDEAIKGFDEAIRLDQNYAKA